jgi:hypothetical protein
MIERGVAHGDRRHPSGAGHTGHSRANHGTLASRTAGERVARHGIVGTAMLL